MNEAFIMQRPLLFLDTSVLFAGVWSATGGARMLLKLGETGIVRLLVGKQVINELNEVLERKSPKSLQTLALLLDRSQVEIVSNPTIEILMDCRKLLDHPGDAEVLAEAWCSDCEFFVTLDKEHFLNNPNLVESPFRIGTPGDCLDWLRGRFFRYVRTL